MVNCTFRFCQESLVSFPTHLCSLRTHFEGLVEAGFDGACPPMRCPFHPKALAQKSLWGPIVGSAAKVSFKLLVLVQTTQKVRTYI